MELNLFDRLLKIDKFYKHGFDSQGNLIFKLSGKVEVETNQKDDKCLYLYEEGKWETEENRLVNSRNSYEFEFLPDNEIKLAHMRFGKKTPVALVEMKFINGLWISKNPHRCEDDNYYADIKYNNSFVQLNWDVNGKDKKYSLSTLYF